MESQGQVPMPARLASRPSTGFYLPSHDNHSHATLSSSTSRRSSFVPSAPTSAPQSPSFHRHGSRASLTALRTALQEYQVPSHSSTPSTGPPPLAPLLPGIEPQTPPNQLATLPGPSGPSVDVPLPPQEPSFSGLRNAYGDGLTREQMDALVEIHRVLYRGREDLEAEGKTLRWREQGEEVQRVVERWFEGDCVYDHPLIRLSSRQALLTHFILLHLLSAFYLPSVGPTALLHHARSITRILRDRLLGVDREADSSSSSPQPTQPAPPAANDKGKAVMRLGAEEEWLGLDSAEPSVKKQRADAEAEESWWKLWDVSADCREIGGMECYDGYHLALIDHVITLTFFPSISRPRSSGLLSNMSTSFSSLDLTAASAPPSFISKVASSAAEELDSLLQWDLPISTIVQFNEVGRATHIRDIIDVRDLIESVVPFARRFNWLTRRLTGFFSSSLGSLAMSLLPSSTRRTITMPRDPIPKERIPAATSPFLAALNQAEARVGLGLGDIRVVPKPKIVRSTTNTRDNLLGLEGVNSMAPDSDAGGSLAPSP